LLHVADLSDAIPKFAEDECPAVLERPQFPFGTLFVGTALYLLVQREQIVFVCAVGDINTATAKRMGLRRVTVGK
jgi:hypothetical protein